MYIMNRDDMFSQVVGGADGVKIAGEMQIDFFHGHHLPIAAARRAAFHAETRPQTRFAQTNYRTLADSVQCVA